MAGAVRQPRVHRDEPERPEAPPGTPEGVDPRQIRVPRLLVVGSEISWRALVCLAAAAVVIYGLTRVGFAVIPVIIALLLSRSEEHTSELQSRQYLVCRLLLEKKNT